MRKAPMRPTNEISQAFNDGFVSVYEVTDDAEPGRKPRPALRLKTRLAYDERRLGLQRLWTGQQAQTRYERVVRVPRGPCTIQTQDVAMLANDAAQYRIDLVQTVPDVWPASLDLTLSRVSQGYPLLREGGADSD